MTEQELIQALRELIAKASADAPDPRQMAREISRRDQLRIRWLAGLSILFWLLAAAGLVLLCVGLDRFVIYVRIMDHYSAPPPRDTDKPAPNGPLPASRDPLSYPRTVRMLDGTQLLHQSIWYIAGSVGTLFLAALCTVLLVTTSRRATLHQINLRLMEMSEALKQLRAGNPFEKVRTLESS
jgi:hypothetical protein